jgi:hypothetical protein
MLVKQRLQQKNEHFHLLPVRQGNSRGKQGAIACLQMPGNKSFSRQNLWRR